MKPNNESNQSHSKHSQHNRMKPIRIKSSPQHQPNPRGPGSNEEVAWSPEGEPPCRPSRKHCYSRACLPRGDSAEAHPEGHRGTQWSRTGRFRWLSGSSLHHEPRGLPGGALPPTRVGQWADNVVRLRSLMPTQPPPMGNRLYYRLQKESGNAT